MTAHKSKIFLVGKEKASLTELVEATYEKEEHLQDYLVQYPDLIPGDQISDPPCRWLLIKREMGVSDGESTGARWSLDHLFVDQDGVPTFIECKRSSDTRGRREVVAQMLDYAANGVEYWGVGEIRRAAERTCAQANTTLEQALVRLLEDESIETIDRFWRSVGENLSNRRIRLIFVADEIPRELKRLVEFLNEQMPNIEVLAVEIKQYQETNGSRKVLVPNVIGATQRAIAIKRAGGRTTSEAFLERCSPLGRVLFTKLFERAEAVGVVVEWGTVGCSIRVIDNDGKRHSIAYCYPPEQFDFYLDPSSFIDDDARANVRRMLRESGLVKESGQNTLKTLLSESNVEPIVDAFENVVKNMCASFPIGR